MSAEVLNSLAYFLEFRNLSHFIKLMSGTFTCPKNYECNHY